MTTTTTLAAALTTIRAVGRDSLDASLIRPGAAAVLRGSALRAVALVTTPAWESARALDVDTDTRRVRAMLVPYGGAVGLTSAGPVTADVGTIRLPDTLGWVKLVDEHQRPPVSVGKLVAAEDTPEGLVGVFQVATGPTGDQLLVELVEGIRDGFSVELVDVDLGEPGDPAQLAASTTGVHTAPGNMEGNNMLTDEQRARLRELLERRDSDGFTDDERTELASLLELAGREAAAADDDGDDGDEDEAPASPAELAASLRRAARLPETGAARRRAPATGRPIRELFAATARVLSGTSRPELEAALADVTNTANIWTGQDEYAGQLWSGLEYRRRFVQLMAPGRLTGYKGHGWRWVVKPEVADYAGDKAAVPSNAPTTEATEWTAARLAGGHDLDRKFFDFGDTEFIEAYYAAMRESYARQSDSKAEAFIVASALAVGGVAETSLFRAAAVAAQAVDDATGGAGVDYLLVNTADRLALLDINESQVPAYLELFGVTPDKFQVSSLVPAGTVVAGNRAATKFRELSETPIRVEALNVANGGVDGGVFGYYATEELLNGGVASKAFA